MKLFVTSPSQNYLLFRICVNNKVYFEYHAIQFNSVASNNKFIYHKMWRKKIFTSRKIGMILSALFWTWEITFCLRMLLRKSVWKGIFIETFANKIHSCNIRDTPNRIRMSFELRLCCEFYKKVLLFAHEISCYTHPLAYLK